MNIRKATIAALQGLFVVSFLCLLAAILFAARVLRT